MKPTRKQMKEISPKNVAILTLNSLQFAKVLTHGKHARVKQRNISNALMIPRQPLATTREPASLHSVHMLMRSAGEPLSEAHALHSSKESTAVISPMIV